MYALRMLCYRLCIHYYIFCEERFFIYEKILLRDENLKIAHASINIPLVPPVTCILDIQELLPSISLESAELLPSSLKLESGLTVSY